MDEKKLKEIVAMNNDDLTNSIFGTRNIKEIKLWRFINFKENRALRKKFLIVKVLFWLTTQNYLLFKFTQNFQFHFKRKKKQILRSTHLNCDDEVHKFFTSFFFEMFFQLILCNYKILQQFQTFLSFKIKGPQLLSTVRHRWSF